jgi:hypothetical protein
MSMITLSPNSFDYIQIRCQIVIPEILHNDPGLFVPSDADRAPNVWRSWRAGHIRNLPGQFSSTVHDVEERSRDSDSSSMCMTDCL